MKRIRLLLAGLLAATTFASAEVEDNGARIQYVASAAQTEFDYPFEITADADLNVYVDGVLQTLTTHYTVAGEGDDAGGELTFLTGRTAGQVITIVRDTAVTRDTTFGQNAPLTSAAFNREFDKLFVISQELEEKISRSLRLPETVEGTGPDFELDPTTFANQYLAFDADGVPTPAALSSTTMTQATIGALLHPRTDAEIAESIFPVAYEFPEGWVTRYGADPTDLGDDTAAIQMALDVGRDVHFPHGIYYANGLTSADNFQRLYGHGRVWIVKNANGDLFTSTGGWFQAHNIDMRGESATPAFTGNNWVLEGAHPSLWNCAGQWAYGRSVLATGTHVQIIGTSGIYQTVDGDEYDIEIGVSGTATLYHAISNIYTSQPDGGILFIDTGSASVVGSQFGKLTVQDGGTTPAGSNGGSYSSNRIIGEVSIDLSNAVFAANVLADDITFEAGTSGHRFDESNQVSNTVVITDNSNNSYVVDSRLIGQLQSFSPVWTSSGDAPDIGNGTIVASYTLQDDRVFFTMTLTFGASTDPGTGNWTFTLPEIPAVRQIGMAQMVEATVNTEGGIVAFSGTDPGTFQVFPTEAPSNAVGATVPFTWGTADTLTVTGEYYK